MRCKARKKFEPQQPFGCEDSNYRSATKQIASYLDFEAMVYVNPNEIDSAN